MRLHVCALAAVAGSILLFAASAEASSKFNTEGLASWYKMGSQTANGEPYDPMGITAAHPSLPFGTRVRVTNRDNGKSVVVRINDRGPFTGGRIIDLSKGAAKAISMRQAGVAKVKIEVVGTSEASAVAGAPGDEPAGAAAHASPVSDPPRFRLMADNLPSSSSR